MQLSDLEWVFSYSPESRVSQIGVPKRGQSMKEKFDGDKQPFFPIFHKKVAFRVVGSRGMVQRR